MPNSVDLEDRTSVFRHAGLIIPLNEIRLGDIIGHGEFGGAQMITLEDCNEFLDLDVLLGVHKDKKVAVKVSKRHGSGMLDSLLDEARFMMLAIQLLYGCW